jgi:hypothetical protein
MINLDDVIFSSVNNSFKNDGDLYTGSINFPTSLTAGQLSITTTAVALGELPQFSKFYAYFQEFLDATIGNPAQWYPCNVGGQFSVGIDVTAPGPEAGWITAGIYPVILGDEVLVTAAVFNPYNVTVTLAALNVPFAFIEYTLAN